MASKKDLVEAQTFSRRRLLTAFVSGAPGGRELEPTKPMRAVATGIGLSVLVVLGSFGFGMLNRDALTGWEDNALVITTDGGSRYVSTEGTLYPVLNTASARLLLTGGLKDPVRVTNDQIADTPRGPTVGIPGAPDALPEPDDLVADGWLSCVSPTGGTTTWLSSGADMASLVSGIEADTADGGPGAGVLVESDGDLYLVAEGRRYLIPEEWRDAVLRAVNPDGAQVWQVPATWLGLFTPGTDLEPFALEDAGEPLDEPISAPEDAVVGSVLSIADAREGDPVHYVINKDGWLSPISGLALELYRIAQSGAPDIEETQGSISAMHMHNADPIAPADWPGDVPEMVGDDLAACAQLSTAAVAEDSATPVLLAGADIRTPEDGSAQVVVDPAGGALVVPVAGTAAAQGTVQLIDATGTAYALPGAEAGDVLSRLGYTPEDVTAVPQAWLALFAVGPELTPEAAGQPYLGEAGSADAADPGGEVCPTDKPTLVPDEPAAISLMGVSATRDLATGYGVVVAVVDSGVDVRNVHLTGGVVLEGVDLVSVDGDPRGWTDVAGHGTAIAGEIAAQVYSSDEGSSGLVGIAPEAQILPVRVYVSTDQQDVDAGLGPRSDRVAAGIRYAADYGAQIINVSLSFTEDVPELADAVAYATERGSLVVASAGNRETTEDKTDSPRYPAAYPDALAVAAVDDTDAPTDSSIHGDHVEIAALGTNVLTSYLGLADCVLGGDGAPSFATGYVSGAAALLAERYPDESPQEWAYRLTVTAARAKADVWSPDVGWGVVRPWAALTFVDDGTALGPDSPTHERADTVVEPVAPVVLTAQTDTLADVRRFSVWWVLGGAAALVGAVLASFPALRRRRRGTRDGSTGPASRQPG